MAKLQNIKALREMLSGTHKFQTKSVYGYDVKNEHKIREVGEIWEEELPNGTVIEWEQKKGYKVRRAKNLKILTEVRQELNQYTNCYEDCEKRKTAKYTQHDKKIRDIHGMCLDCLAKYETHLKVKGEFEEYERQRHLESARAFFRDAEKEKEVIKAALNTIEYVEEDGSKELWESSNKQALLDKIDSDFEKLKDSILKPLENGNIN
jgi:chlorite dismutase